MQERIHRPFSKKPTNRSEPPTFAKHPLASQAQPAPKPPTHQAEYSSQESSLRTNFADIPVGSLRSTLLPPIRQSSLLPPFQAGTWQQSSQRFQSIDTSAATQVGQEQSAKLQKQEPLEIVQRSKDEEEDVSDVKTLPLSPTCNGAVKPNDVELLMKKSSSGLRDILVSGKTVYVRNLGGDADKNCHHYAFGGLSGADILFNAKVLAKTLGNKYSTLKEYMEEELYLTQEYLAKLDPEKKQLTLRDAQIAYEEHVSSAFKDLDNQTVDVAKLCGLSGTQGKYKIRVYDTNAHSARYEGGKWWHKLMGAPYLISVDGYDNLHYSSVTANITIVSVAAPKGASGSFVVSKN